MTVNTNGAEFKGTTPPSTRTVRHMFRHYLQKLWKHYDEVKAVETEYQSQVGIRFESSVIAAVAASEDIRWKQAVADEQFAERLANTHGLAAILSAIDALTAEQMNTNTLLCASLLQDPEETKATVMRYLRSRRLPEGTAKVS